MYDVLVDAMFHMLRHGAAEQPAVIIHLAGALGSVAAVEEDPSRRATLRRHLDLVRDVARGQGYGASARAALEERLAAALATLGRAASGRVAA